MQQRKNYKAADGRRSPRRRSPLAFIAYALLFILSVNILAAPPARRTNRPRRQSDKRIHLLHSDELFYDKRRNPDAQILRGHVRFSHDGVILTCDSAYYYEQDNSFDAFGHVKMNQHDTLTLASRTLFYDGNNQMAQARHDVVLTHYKSKLYTDSLDYDRLYELGYFFQGGKLVDKDNVLTSEWGQYSPATREAIFNYNVDLKNPKFTLLSDTLHYNTGSGFARIVGPSNIDNGDNHIYSERGTYDTRADRAYLLDRSIVSNKGITITGDSLDYTGAGAISKAFGDVVYVDKDSRNMFTGNYVLYADSIGYAEAADSAVAIDYSQRDTLYVHADTFKLYTYDIDTDTVWREMRAYNHVRAFRIDMQAVCDSMVFITRDSCLTMYRDPILWQQGQQLLGEEIKAWVNDSTIDSTYVIRQALSVERLDTMCYNQVTGNIMRSYFTGGKMKMTWAEGNVIVRYYPLDSDSLMIGLLESESAELKLFMGEKQLDKIWMPEAEGKLHPLALATRKERYLENFGWFDYVRPVSKDDIFDWRPKRAGFELKESVQHTKPKATLSDKPTASSSTNTNTKEKSEEDVLK